MTQAAPMAAAPMTKLAGSRSPLLRRWLAFRFCEVLGGPRTPKRPEDPTDTIQNMNDRTIENSSITAFVCFLCILARVGFSIFLRGAVYYSRISGGFMLSFQFPDWL